MRVRVDALGLLRYNLLFASESQTIVKLGMNLKE
mgnify:CR=1 FL=1